MWFFYQTNLISIIKENSEEYEYLLWNECHTIQFHELKSYTGYSASVHQLPQNNAIIFDSEKQSLRALRSNYIDFYDISEFD